MKVLGIDPSLTSTGICYEGYAEQIVTARIQPGKFLKGPSRLFHIYSVIENTMDRVFDYHEKGNVVAYEGYAMGSSKAKGRAFDMGELGGVLKTLAYSKGVGILLVPPTSLKLYATGSGRAEKVDVMKAVKDNWGYDIRYDDEADAFVLYKMGCQFISDLKVRASHRAQALNSCTYVPGAILSK